MFWLSEFSGCCPVFLGERVKADLEVRVFLFELVRGSWRSETVETSYFGMISGNYDQIRLKCVYGGSRPKVDIGNEFEDATPFRLFKRVVFVRCKGVVIIVPEG